MDIGTLFLRPRDPRPQTPCCVLECVSLTLYTYDDGPRRLGGIPRRVHSPLAVQALAYLETK